MLSSEKNQSKKNAPHVAKIESPLLTGSNESLTRREITRRREEKTKVQAVFCIKAANTEVIAGEKTLPDKPVWEGQNYTQITPTKLFLQYILTKNKFRRTLTCGIIIFQDSANTAWI